MSQANHICISFTHHHKMHFTRLSVNADRKFRIKNARCRFRTLGFKIRSNLRHLRFPAWRDSLKHTSAGYLVDAERLPGFPARHAKLDEIRRDLVQSFVGGDDLVVLVEQLIEQSGWSEASSASSIFSATLALLNRAALGGEVQLLDIV